MLHALSDCAIVGRQSIRDRDLAVAGYELLTSIGDPARAEGENTGENDAENDAEDAGPLSVEAGISTDAGLNLLVGDTVAYFPAVRSLIAGETELAAPWGRVVLELDESWNA